MTAEHGMTQDPGVAPLGELGAVRVKGADNLRFLQGQLSNDTQKLTPSSSQLAGLHTPQGRTIAMLRLIVVGPDEVLAVLPRELAAPVAARLSKFVLRAKAKVTDASADWQFSGLLADPADGTSLPTTVGAQAQIDSSFVVRISDSPARWLVAAPASGGGHPLPAAIPHDQWHALDIAAGIPQVYAATSEAFVAQMLNLDVLDAVSFEKGCYTGQEVIARAHYRGRVKRRMQRFRTLAPARLAPGDAGKLRDGRSFRVVDSVQLADGRCEFLAVAPTASGVEDAGDGASPAGGIEPSINAEQLSLPYALPA